MPDREPTLAVLAEWVLFAEHDFLAAGHVLKLGEDCPTDAVCLHAQQCVEKYMKAILVMEGIEFPKVHDLERIAALLPAHAHLSLTPDEEGMLTEYVTVARYPPWREIPLAEARKALAIARRVRKEVRRLLPRSVLRRKKA